MDGWAVVRDLMFGVLAAIPLFFFFRKVVRLTRWWTIGATILTAGLFAAGFVMSLACRAYGLDRLRLVATILSSCITLVLYFALLSLLVCVMDIVWWAFTRPGQNDPADQFVGKHALIDEDFPQAPPRNSNRIWAVRTSTVVVAALSAMITGYGYVQAQSPTISPVTVSFPDLPSNFDRMTIALVTDVHISSMTRSSFLPMVVDQINDARPDLIVIAGDIVDGTVANLGDRMSELKNLTAPYGVVVTLGNHETYSGSEEWSRFFESLGLRVLTNDGILLTRGSQSVSLVGVADLKQPGALAPDLARAVNRTGSCEDTFCILAAHEPRQVLADDGLASRLGIDLQLSGHTHGGQLWPLGYLTLFTQPAIDKVHAIDGVTLVTSRGVGTFRPPERVGADPEIPLITLTAG